MFTLIGTRNNEYIIKHQMYLRKNNRQCLFVIDDKRRRQEAVRLICSNDNTNILNEIKQNLTNNVPQVRLERMRNDISKEMSRTELTREAKIHNVSDEKKFGLTRKKKMINVVKNDGLKICIKKIDNVFKMTGISSVYFRDSSTSNLSSGSITENIPFDVDSSNVLHKPSPVPDGKKENQSITENIPFDVGASNHSHKSSPVLDNEGEDNVSLNMNFTKFINRDIFGKSSTPNTSGMQEKNVIPVITESDVGLSSPINMEENKNSMTDNECSIVNKSHDRVINKAPSNSASYEAENLINENPDGNPTVSQGLHHYELPNMTETSPSPKHIDELPVTSVEMNLEGALEKGPLDDNSRDNLTLETNGNDDHWMISISENEVSRNDSEAIINPNDEEQCPKDFVAKNRDLYTEPCFLDEVSFNILADKKDDVEKRTHTGTFTKKLPSKSNQNGIFYENGTNRDSGTKKVDYDNDGKVFEDTSVKNTCKINSFSDDPLLKNMNLTEGSFLQKGFYEGVTVGEEHSDESDARKKKLHNRLDLSRSFNCENANEFDRVFLEYGEFLNMSEEEEKTILEFEDNLDAETNDSTAVDEHCNKLIETTVAEINYSVNQSVEISQEGPGNDVSWHLNSHIVEKGGEKTDHTGGNMDEKNSTTEDELTEDEKRQCSEYARFILRGKLGRTVGLLLDQKMLKCIELLIKYRSEAGVHKDNPYIFASPGDIQYKSHHLKSCELMRKYRCQVGATAPHTLRGTEMRKHLATNLLSFNPHANRDDVAKHMGHGLKIHKDFYQLSTARTEITQLTPLLERACRKINIRNIEKPSTSSSSEFIETKNSEHTLDGLEAAFEIIDHDSAGSMRTDESANREEKGCHEPVVHEIGKSSTPADLNSSNDSFVDSAWKNSKKKTLKRKGKSDSNDQGQIKTKKLRWGPDEISAMRTIFASNIESQTYPSLKDLEDVQKKNQVFKNRNAASMKTWFQNNCGWHKK